jgi:hypothetical protein
MNVHKAIKRYHQQLQSRFRAATTVEFAKDPLRGLVLRLEVRVVPWRLSRMDEFLHNVLMIVPGW